MSRHNSLLLFLLMLTILPASALTTVDLENSRILFEQNFESVSDASSTGWTFGGDSMSIQSDAFGKFIRFSLGQTNPRSAQLTWGQDIFFKNGTSVLPDGCYRICYDFSIAQGSNNQYNSELTVFTNHEPVFNQSYRTPWSPEGYWQNYLFDMSQVADESYGYAIDGGTVETVGEDGTVSYSIDYSDYDTFEQGKWYTVNLDVDVNARTVKYSVVSLEGEMVKSGIRNVPLTDINGNQISMYAEGLFIMLARYQTIYQIDNILISYEKKDNVYELIRSWDFARMSEDDIRNLGFPDFQILNSPATSGFNNWTARKRLYYFVDGSGHLNDDLEYIYDPAYPFGFISEDNENNVIRYTVIDNSELTDPVYKSKYFDGLTIFPDKGNLSAGYPNVGIIYHIGLYNDQTRNSYNNVIVHGLHSDEVVVFNTISNYGSNSTHPICKNDEEYYACLEGADSIYNVREKGLWNETTNSYDVIFPLYRIDTALVKISVFKNRQSSPVAGDDFEYEGLWYTVIDPEAKTCRTRNGSPVSSGEALKAGNTFSGDLSIPSTVFFDSEEFTVIEIGSYGFSAVSTLNSVAIPESVTKIGLDAFYECSGLSSVSLPNTLREIGPYAFNECVSLTEISLPESLTSLSDNVFGSCTSLMSVEFPNSLTSIGEYAFSGCRKLEEIRIPDAVISLGTGAFSGCANLEKVSLPSSLQSAGTLLFLGCEFIDEVNYKVETPLALSQYVFEEDVYEFAVLNMPDTPLATIQATVPWNRFNKIIANDGSIGFAAAGDDFEYQGIWYTILDPEAKTCKTKNGSQSEPGNPYEGDLVIPSVVSDGTYSYTVTEIGMYSFIFCRNLNSLTLPETLVAIQDGAFDGCGITAVDLPKSLEFIGNGAFSSTSLINIIIPDELKIIDNYAFWSCGNLESVTLPSSLESMGDCTFHHCAKLRYVTYPADVPKEFPDAVFQCGESGNEVYDSATLNMPNALLADIISTIPWNKFKHIIAKDGEILPPLAAGDDFEYQGIWYTVIDPEAKTCKTKAGTEIEGGWLSGNSITGDIVIPSMVSDGMYDYRVTEIGIASFAGSSIGSIAIPESVMIIGEHSFNGCTLLSSVSLPDNIVSIEVGTFYGCKELSSINMPESLDSIRGVAFCGCEKLSTIKFPEKLSYIGALSFQNCSGLSSIELPASLSHIGIIAFGGTGLMDVVYYAVDPIKADENVFEIYDYATLHAPNATLSEVLATTPWNLFKHIAAADGSVGVVKAGDEFEYEGIWYTVIDLEAKTCKTKDGTVADGQYAAGNDFNGNLVIPATVSEGVYDYTVTALGWAGFANATGLTSVVLPHTITSIPESTFNGCSNLTSVSIPESVTSISVYAFSGCSSLKEVKLPDALTSLGYSAFGNCSSLTSIVIPESLTQLQNQTFAGCSSLQNIDIPATVESFDYRVFGGCATDVAVTYRAEAPIVAGEDLFDIDAYTNGTLNMPNAPLAIVQTTLPWSKFKRIVANDDSTGFVSAGDDFEYEGVRYTILDPEEKTCKTKDHGNDVAGNLIIPAAASYENEEYSVIEIGQESFRGSESLLSVTLPASIQVIGTDAFANCQSLTSLVWTRHESLNRKVIDEIGNPNLLLYVDSLNFAPEGMTANVVADGVCEHLDLTPGHAFTPLTPFTSLQSRMVKEFTQKTYIDVCAGWETILLPFDAGEVYAENIGSPLTPFAALTDMQAQRPFWLYEADEAGLWKEASGIRAGVPCIISMPNNPGYVSGYSIEGDVVFSSTDPQLITPETTAPYAVDWASGRQFRSLWLPLTKEEAEDAMGLNVGMSWLTGDDGEQLPPGSAFHVGVTPKPLEAYVTRIGSERAMKVMGDKSGVLPVIADSSLDIRVESGVIYARSSYDLTVCVFTPEGTTVRVLDLKAGITVTVDDLTPGIYIAAGRKVIVK